MAGPVIPPNPIPAINKIYSDIKFFLKNAETTKAFVDTAFRGDSDGYLQEDGVTKIPYPNEDFDNTLENVPYIDLDYLSQLYELKSPELLEESAGVSLDGFTVTAASECFADIPIDTYILYRLSGDQGGLKVLGYIQSKTSDTEVVLSSAAPEETQEAQIEIYSWTGELNAETLNVLNFNFQDSFYMVVKNADYSAPGAHDAVLLIDTTKTASNYTTFPQPFAYSLSRIANPNYFSLQRISKVKNPTILEENVINIQCSIKGVSKWSEKSLIETSVGTINPTTIPYWSVYEIDPNPNSNIHLDKKTFYRLIINDFNPGGLPSSRIYFDTTPPEE